METAIRKAIEGGWKPKHWMYESGLKTETIFEKTYLVIRDGVTTQHLQYSEVREDPLFWQALGKAKRWVEDVCILCGTPNDLGDENDTTDYEVCEECHLDFIENDYATTVPEWKYRRAKLLEHIDAGLDIDSFFKDLLAQ